MKTVYIETLNTFASFDRATAAAMLRSARAQGKTPRRIIGGWKF